MTKTYFPARLLPGGGNNRRFRRLIAAVGCALLFFSGVCFFFPAPAHADPGGTLTVRVGYLGYEYQVRKTYTAADLRALGTDLQYYSWVDGLPSVVYMAAEGVQLWNIIADAGIDPGSAQRYYFRASDGHEPVQEFTSDSLFYTGRYCFPNLNLNMYYDAEYIDEEGAMQTERVYYADQTLDAGQAVPMIALNEEHARFDEHEAPDWAGLSTDMRTADGFRLVYGAAYVGDPYASFTNSVRLITHIDVLLVGSPPQEPGENDEDDYIGADPSNETPETGNDESDGGGRGTGDGDGTGAGSGEGTGGGEGGTGAGDGGTGEGAAGGTGGGEGTAGSESASGGMGIEIGAAASDAEAITLSDGTVVNGREIKGSKILMELNAIGGGGGGGKSDGDDPWKAYDIADESTPLKLPYEKESAAAVSGVMGLSFLFGAVAQGETPLLFFVPIRKRKEI
jgi:hypothetical protein